MISYDSTQTYCTSIVRSFNFKKLYALDSRFVLKKKHHLKNVSSYDQHPMNIGLCQLLLFIIIKKQEKII